MSKRNERREAERAARKLAHQQLLHPESAEEPSIQSLPEQSPISEAQLQANRANAQLSHGPVTPEGKAVSSRNNTRHGLAAEPDGDSFRVLANESQSTYDQSLADFRAEWKPITATERDLVHRMIMHQWLYRRALRLQESLFDSQTGEVIDVKKFELYRRYETSHERGFNKAFADIQRLRSFQLREQNGFESQRRKNAEHTVKMTRLKRQEEASIQKIAVAAARANRIQHVNLAELRKNNAA